MDEVSEDQVGQSSFQGAAGLVGCLVFGDLPAVEVLSWPASAGLAEAMMWIAALSCRLPSRLSRCRFWSPLEASRGAVPL